MSINKVSSNMRVDDIVDKQIEHYIDRMQRYGFKPCEGLTQGYIESQRIFARVGLIILAIAEAVTQENSKDAVSIDDNILRAVKTLKAYCRLYGMKSVLGDVPEIIQLQSSAKERNNLYAVSFDDCCTKSIAWCVASMIRIYVVAGMYDITDTPGDTSTQAYIDFAKKVLVADYDIHSFNYGAYQRQSKPLYGRKISDDDRLHAGTHGPMDKFVGGTQASPAAARRRPAMIQEVVDALKCTQDTLSELLTPGKYNGEHGVTISVASAYDAAGADTGNADSANSLIMHVSGLCTAVSRIQPDSTYTHKASQYEQNSIFYNIPRNVRGQCIYKYSSRAGGRSTWEIQHKITNQSYMEDVGCGAIGYEALRRMSNVICMCTGGMLATLLDDSGTLIPTTDDDGRGINIEELLLLCIIADDEDNPSNNIIRTSSRGDPLLEDVLTNNLLNMRLVMSRGMPTNDDGDVVPLTDIMFCAIIMPPLYTEPCQIAPFFSRAVNMALNITDSISHAQPGYAEALSEYVEENNTFPQASINLAWMYQHSTTESSPDAKVSYGSEPRPTIGNSITNDDGQTLAPTAYRSIGLTFLKPLADIRRYDA